MKKTQIFNFAVFLSVAMLLSGCGKARLESENADLRARLDKLEQQLQDANRQIGSGQTSIKDLQTALDEAKKRAEHSETEFKTISSQVETQKEKIDNLTQQISNYQKAKEKDEKDLELYRDKTTSAIRELKALRSTLEEDTVKFDSYSQNYLQTKMEITRLIDPLPESKVRREILGILGVFTDIKSTWETATADMDRRTQQAEADYDRYTFHAGLGSSEFLEINGKLKILLPAEKENLKTASDRDAKIASLEQDIDKRIKNFQDLINPQQT